METRQLRAASLTAAIVLAAVAGVAALVADMPRLLALAGTYDVAGDLAPWAAILLAWETRALGAGRHAELLWTLPSDLFRDGLLVGGVSVVGARTALALLPVSGRGPAAIIATTAEDIFYGLGIVALGSLAAFALTRTVLRPALREQTAPPSARDISLRTRFVVIATGTSFATAGVLLEALVDFETASEGTLVAYVSLAVALVAFASIIGWLVGDDTRRGVTSVAQRLRGMAGPGAARRTPPRLAADEIGSLAAAAMEIERRLRADEARSAATAERDRIARELHDGVAKSVSVLALEAATAAAHATGDLRPELTRIQRLARLLSDELRAIVTDVRARDEGRPFADMLRSIAERHAPATVTIDGDVERIGTLARFEVLRIVDEALTNAKRHAHASRLSASVAVCGDRVAVDVEDDGVGLGPVEWESLSRAGRYGLVGMRERAGLVGGELRVDRGPLGGTLVHVEFPLVAE